MFSHPWSFIKGYHRSSSNGSRSSRREASVPRSPTPPGRARSSSDPSEDVGSEIMEEGVASRLILPPGAIPDVSRTYYEASSSVEDLGPYPPVIHLNVGGRRLTTTLNTLRKDPESKLSQMFSGHVNNPASSFVVLDTDGSYAIDRDGRVFHHILNYLRDGSVPIGLTNVQRLQLLHEAHYFGLRHLYFIAGGLQQPHDVGSDVNVAWSDNMPRPEDFGAPPAGKPSSGYWATYKASRYVPGKSIPSRRPGSHPGSSTSSYSDAPGAGLSHTTTSSFLSQVQACAPGDDPRLRREKVRSDAVALGFLPPQRSSRQFARLRYGMEYGGDWIVSSPRNLPNVEYELHGACLTRGPIDAMNKMSKAGWKPCEYPPRLPPQQKIYTSEWRILMYRDA